MKSGMFLCVRRVLKAISFLYLIIFTISSPVLAASLWKGQGDCSSIMHNAVPQSLASAGNLQNENVNPEVQLVQTDEEACRPQINGTGRKECYLRKTKCFVFVLKCIHCCYSPNGDLLPEETETCGTCLITPF